MFSKKESEVLKGIAVVILVYYHAVGLMGDSVIINRVFQTILSRTGNICVSIFALISMYGLALKLVDMSNLEILKYYPRFILKRICVIYRSYWPAFLLGFSVAILREVIFIGGYGEPVFEYTYGGYDSRMIFRILVNLFGLSHLKYGNGYNTLNQTWWYISLVLVMIVLLPFMVVATRKFGKKTYIYAVVIALIVEIKYIGYLPVLILGILLADGNIRFRLKLGTNVFIHFMVIILWAVARYFIVVPRFDDLANSLVVYSMIQILLVLTKKCSTEIIQLIQYLGKHSGNIFYVHSFVYIYWPTSILIYRLKFDVLVVAVTIILSIVISCILEYLKNKTGWNAMFNKIEQRLL